MVDINKVRVSDLWYVIGYIATDGSLSQNGRQIYITSKDRYHLFAIRKALFLKNRIGKKASEIGKKKIYSYLQFGDVVFYQYLTNIGLTPKKSLTLQPLVVNDEYFLDFLRGVIDGDGNISTWIHRTNSHPQRCLRIYSASPKFIHCFNDKIAQSFSVRGKLYTNKRNSKGNISYLIKFGKKAAIRILRELYYENCLSLERKFLQAQLCLQHKSKNGKLCR